MRSLKCGVVLYTMLLSTLTHSPFSHAESEFPISTPLGGVESPYTTPMVKLAQDWSPAPREFPDFSVTCYETKGNPYYIGMLQRQRIRADFEIVVGILDDFAHYKDLFVDFKDIHVVSRDRNRSVSYWEQKSPVFFLPNIKYQMHYIVSQPSAGLKIYRYQLKEPGKIKYDDGIIVVERSAPGSTLMSEYDFWDAEWGILKDTMPGKIWPENVKGNILTNLAIQLKAEHPDWDYSKIHHEAEKNLKQIKWQESIEHKKTFMLAPSKSSK